MEYKYETCQACGGLRLNGKIYSKLIGCKASCPHSFKRITHDSFKELLAGRYYG